MAIVSLTSKLIAVPSAGRNLDFPSAGWLAERVAHRLQLERFDKPGPADILTINNKGGQTCIPYQSWGAPLIPPWRDEDGGNSFIRIGRLFIIDEKLYEWLAQEPQGRELIEAVRPNWILMQRLRGITQGPDSPMGFTASAVAAMMAFDWHGFHVIDVGASSGILSLVAAALGAQRITLIEIDPSKVADSQNNLRLNSLDPLDRSHVVQGDIRHPARILKLHGLTPGASSHSNSFAVCPASSRP